MKNITFLNIKGGVAKTTSSVAVAQILSSEYGKRVLLIDADQQGNATMSLLGDAEPEYTTADLLIKPELIAEKAVCHSKYGVDVIPACFDLSFANKQNLLDFSANRLLHLKMQMETLKDNYDYCIIDCPPDISSAVMNALAMTDYVLIPVRADKYGLDGLKYVQNAINDVFGINPQIEVLGLFLTMYQKRTNLTYFVRQIMTDYRFPVLASSIRQSTSVGVSTFGEPLMNYAPHSAVADDYRELVKEIITKIKEK